MTLLANLIRAEEAVKFANDQLRGRSSNRPEDIIHTLQHNIRQRYANNPERAQDVYSEHLRGGDVQYSLPYKGVLLQRDRDISSARANRRLQNQRLNAAAIIAGNVGNCFEHSVLACHYLKNQWNIASYMAETEDWNIDHCFVLIGAPNGLDGQTINVTQQAPGAIAGAFTVVCDPWYHEWFAVQQDWGRKMWHIFSATKEDKGKATPNGLMLKLTSSSHVT